MNVEREKGDGRDNDETKGGDGGEADSGGEDVLGVSGNIGALGGSNPFELLLVVFGSDRERVNGFFLHFGL